jgi:hypothetical protein
MATIIPQVSIAEKLEKYYDLGDLKLGSGVDEVFNFRISCLDFLLT